MDADVKTLFEAVAARFEAVARQQSVANSNIRALGEQLDKFIRRQDKRDAAVAANMVAMDKRLTAADERLAARMGSFMAGVDERMARSEVRMTRIEKKLENLLDAIIREHPNGKGKK